MAPMQRQIRKALGVVKDQTSIGLAKVASNGAPELDVALVKATSHDEAPIEEKYLQEILHLTSYSRSYLMACISGISKRLGKTHNWIVAIKALMLIYRLLRDGDPVFEQELLYAGRRGMRVLHLSDFRDDTHSNGWDYSAFVRTYALFLDERLDSTPALKHLEARSSFHDRNYAIVEYGSHSAEYGSHSADYGSHSADYGSGHGKRETSPQHQKSKATKDMTPQELLEKLPSPQRLLERILACRPTGAAKHHRLVQIALYPIVRESFQIYSDICEGLAVLLDAFFEMEHQDCVKAFEIYSRGAKQADELVSFYGFCRNVGVCRSSDQFPAVQKIGEELLETMEEFLRDRSNTNSRAGRAADLKSRKSFNERDSDVADEAAYEMNGIKALPAPPVEDPIPQPETAAFQKQESEADLLNLDHATISSEEHGNRLALALFSTTDTNSNKSWEPFSASASQASSDVNAATSVTSDSEKGATGWELALVASASQLSKDNSNPMAGGFDRLLLDSLYEQAVDSRQESSVLQAGSLSSVAVPGRPVSSFLALPAPVPQAGGADPFTASSNFPPPSYVQMDEMTKKQQLLVQEQKLWLGYERDGMQGYNGLLKYYNNHHLASFQNAYAVPYYSTGRYAAY